MRHSVLCTLQLSGNSACSYCALITIVNIFNNWSVAVVTVPWLIWSQQFNRTHFR